MNEWCLQVDICTVRRVLFNEFWVSYGCIELAGRQNDFLHCRIFLTINRRKGENHDLAKFLADTATLARAYEKEGC